MYKESHKKEKTFQPSLRVGPFEVDVKNKVTMTGDGELIKLTPTETVLLCTLPTDGLISYVEIGIVTRRLANLTGTISPLDDENGIRTHIDRLRRKLDKDRKIIKNKYGFGYGIEDDNTH